MASELVQIEDNITPSEFGQFENKIIMLAGKFKIPLSLLQDVDVAKFSDLNEVREHIHECLPGNLKNQDMCRNLISKNEALKHEDKTTKDNILRKLYLMSAIAEPDEDGNLSNDETAIDMNARIHMTAFHFVNFLQREFEELCEEKKNKSTMCDILNEYMETASDIVGQFNVPRLLKIALDLCMYDSRRSFWTEYKLRHMLGSCGVPSVSCHAAVPSARARASASVSSRGSSGFRSQYAASLCRTQIRGSAYPAVPCCCARHVGPEAWPPAPGVDAESLTAQAVHAISKKL